ncbi:MAG: hypothetical protein AAGK78_13830, partial [Planctomycetota bacterium]
MAQMADSFRERVVLLDPPDRRGFMVVVAGRRKNGRRRAVRIAPSGCGQSNRDELSVFATMDALDGRGLVFHGAREAFDGLVVAHQFAERPSDRFVVCIAVERFRASVPVRHAPAARKRSTAMHTTKRSDGRSANWCA